MTSSSQMLMALRRVALGFAAVLLILLAVSFSLFRLLLPEIPELQRDIEAMASKAVGKPLVIGEMEAEWAGWGPRLVFKNVSIRSPIDNDELVALGQLTLGTHFLQLLSDQPWRPASVDAEGLRLVVEQKENGSLRLRGFDGSESNEGDFLGPLLDFLAARGTISLGRTEIVWVPAEGTQLEPESAWFDLSFRSGGGRYHIELSGKPPASIGEDVELVLDAEGSMADMVNMRGEVFTRVGGFQLHSPWVQPLLAFLPVDVKAGYLESGDVSLRWDRQKTTKVTSRVSLTRLQVSLPNESEAQKDMHLVEGFEGDLSWASHGSSSEETDTIKNLAELGKRWTLSSENATLTVAGEPIQIKGFKVDSEIGEDALNEQHFVGKLDSLTWGRVFDQAEGLPLPDEMGNLLQRLAPAGGIMIKRFDVARSIEQGTHIEAAGQFDRLSWRTGMVQSKADDPTHKGWPGLKNVSGSFDLKGNKVALKLDSQDLVISWPWLYSGERSVDSAKGDFVVNWSTPTADKVRHLVVQSDNLQLQKNKASADVQVGVDVALTKPKVTGWLTLDGDVRGGTVPMVKEFIPAFTPDTAHQWLDKALLAGNLDAEVAINGPLNGFPYENDEGKFSADAYVVNAGLQFAEQWPAVENASGKLAFRNMSLMADIEEAATADIPVQKLRVQIPNLKRANV
ncbi:MAG: DUF3971 domain-containing protein, partial [Gammaproteobacteria bacterium]|nr:DUF3971 domain-containing protein [Gammaproteobacteria bacterium]